MHRTENFRKILKIFIVALLCSELQSNFQLQSTKNVVNGYAYAAELNGSYATPENSKYHASIRLATMDINFGEGHICSGALIGPSVILTAGQCVFNYADNSPRHPSELKVVLAAQNRYQRMQHTLVYGVTHLYTPPTFDSHTLRDNIAILMLERDILENTYVKPITLSTLDSKSTVATADLKVTTWAITKKGTPLPPLMLLNATKSSDSLCKGSFGKFYAHDMVCVSLIDVNSNACHFDIGAPLISDDELIGLNSIGNEGGLTSLPAIYTDVRQHKAWILDKIGNGSSQNSSIWGTIGFLAFTAFAVKTFNFRKRQVRVFF